MKPVWGTCDLDSPLDGVITRACIDIIVAVAQIDIVIDALVRNEFGGVKQIFEIIRVQVGRRVVQLQRIQTAIFEELAHAAHINGGDG